MEGIWCGARGIECASASKDGVGASGSESHEGSYWFKTRHGGYRLRNAGRRTVTPVRSVSTCGCGLYSVCKRHGTRPLGLA
jgi:hypothetical protein